MKQRRLFLLVMVGFALGLAAPAGATPPDRFSFEESGTELGFVQCDGFAIDLETTGIFHATVFFNRNGEVARFIVRGRITEVATNSVTGKFTTNRGVFQDFFTRIDGTDDFIHTVSGFDFLGKVGGHGPIVFQEVGRKVLETDPETGEEILVSQVGHDTLPDGPAAEAVFCAALS
jgi:hypothetical protein